MYYADRRPQCSVEVLIPDFKGDPAALRTVLDAGPDWNEISSADFGEDAYASPAIVDGRLFVRTNGHLYCFGLPGTPK